MLKEKWKGWLKRYLPGEIIGTVTALGVATIVHFFYDNKIIVAYAGAFGEAIGFYTTVFIQNLLLENKKQTGIIKKFSINLYLKIFSRMLLEFGPAGFIDGVLLRPFFMYIFPTILKNFTLGIFVGKIIGDITFYLLVIISYEYAKLKRLFK